MPLNKSITFTSDFLSEIEKFRPRFDEPLAPYTTWKIGGPADIVIALTSSEDLVTLVKLAQKYSIPYTILGGGSNVLISDKGIRGLVILNRSRDITILEHEVAIDKTVSSNPSSDNQPDTYVQPRHGEADPNFYSFTDLDYDDVGESVFVRFASGVDLAFAIASTIRQGVTGLQWFGGIPGTIGGALYNNIHGGTRHFSDVFQHANVIMPNGDVETIYFKDFNFGYDQSLLRDKPGTVVVDVTLRLTRGNVDRAKFTANEWTKRKRLQPRITAGCTFQNIPVDTQLKQGWPSPSAGYITDKLLGWKGKQFGGVVISESHGNFIENIGGGTAQDVRDAMTAIRDEVKKQYGIDLLPEISLLGFEEN